MKKKIFIAAAVIISTAAHAQDDSTKLLNEVSVTANKFLQKAEQTGKVITIISSEQLEKAKGKTLPQILNEQAGITVNGAYTATGSNQTLYMRGAGAGRTLVLLDGIPVYDPSFINSEFDLNLLLIADIERIEICRGAQSTLYGSDAVAGVVNIITIKKDVIKAVNAKLTASVGSLGTLRENVQIYGKKNKLTYNLRASHMNTKGFSSAYDSTGKNNFDKDGYNGGNASLALQYQLTGPLSVRSFIQYSKYKSDVDATIFTDEKDFTIKNKSLITGTGFQFKNNSVSLTGNYQYSETNRNYLNDSIDLVGFSKYAKDDYFSKTQFAEIYASIPLHKSFTLLQGADYRWASMNNQYHSISSFGPYSSTFKDTSTSQASLYASLFYKSANEKLNIDLGGRLNVHSRYGNNATYTFNPSFNFDKHYRIFGSIATGFKAPTLFQLYSSSGNENLEPEKSKKCYEIGLAASYKKISNRILFFYRETNNGLDFNYINFTYFNFIKQIVRGVEWETVLKPTEKLDISLNYTYLHANERTQSRKTFNDTSYNHLLRRPDHTLNLNAGMQFTKALYASVNAKYVSSRYDVGGFSADDIMLNSYFILGAHATYKFSEKIKAFADAQNITGKKFFDVRGYNSIPFCLNAGVTLEL